MKKLSFYILALLIFGFTFMIHAQDVPHVETERLWTTGQDTVVELENEGFESGLGNFVNNGIVNWTTTGAKAMQGSMSATSNPVVGGQTAILDLSVPVPAGFMATVSFYILADTTQGPDMTDDVRIGFKIDGTVQSDVLIYTAWTEKRYFIPEGVHTLSWRVYHNIPGSDDQVQAYLDTVVVSYQQRPALRIADGSEGFGKILVSDAQGNASWRTPVELTSYDNPDASFLVPLALDGRHQVNYPLSIVNGNNVGVRSISNNIGFDAHNNNFDGFVSEYNGGVGFKARDNGSNGFYADDNAEHGFYAEYNGNDGFYAYYNTDNGFTSRGNGDDGFYARGNGGYGFYAYINAWDGFRAFYNDGDGFDASNNGNHGFNAYNNTDDGFYASSNDDDGFYAYSNDTNGFNAHSNGVHGFKATNNTEYGYYAALNGNDGFHSRFNTDDGFYAYNNDDDGFYANNNTDDGFHAYNNDDDGFIAEYNGDDGFHASDNTGDGFFAASNGGYAGNFYGDVQVTGTLSKGGGSFKIDHLLDPENKLLFHSFVESPDMMNVYNGNVILDAHGEAVVQLEEWFEPLNRDFRYQLTCIGGFAPVYIAEKISHNQFKIAGGTPGLEVSWQVTGIRQDPWANQNRIEVEVEKPAEFKGYYLHPEAYGRSFESGFSYVKNGYKTLEELKAESETRNRGSGKNHDREGE